MKVKIRVKKARLQPTEKEIKKATEELFDVLNKGTLNEKKLNELLDKGTDINDTDILKIIPLYYAIQKNSVAMVESLLNVGARIDIQDVYGKTALDYLNKNSFSEIKKLLKNKSEENLNTA